MGNLEVAKAIQALIPAELCASLEDTGDLTHNLHMAAQQEVVINLIYMYHQRLRDERGMDKTAAKAKALTLASQMLDCGDCTLDTFGRIKRELTTTQEQNAVPELSLITSQIIAGLSAMEHPEITFSPEETHNLNEYTAAFVDCRKKAEVVITMLRGHIAPIAEKLLTRYISLI